MSVKRLTMLFATVALLGALIPATALAAAGGGGNTSNNLCPSSNALANFVPYSNVAASSTGTDTNRTYYFKSFTSENVPGLVGYCVYPIDTATSGATASYPNWTATLLKGTKGFVFQRSGGDKTDVPLDGSTYTIGTATFAGWTGETILLHVNDAAQCTILYGAGSSASCWVKPSAPVGPICDRGSADTTGVAYSDIPRDAVNCGPPSHAFEATQTKEFGDEVGLAASGPLSSLTVLFNSYACGDNPLWNNPGCGTTPGDTFQQAITANIYAVGANHTVGAKLATATQTFTIPFRPSADTVKCGTTGEWFNTVSGQCEFSAKVLLTFTNWDANPALSGNVIWTVAFGTSTNGGLPAPDTSQCQLGGCPYDSLNVGTKTYLNAPYVGAFADSHAAFIDSTWNGIYCDDGLGGTGTLRVSTNPPAPCTNTEAVNNYAADAWLGLKPLGQIVLGP